jgi:tubulin alpha
VEPYNTVLAEHSIMQHQDASIVLDNEAIYDICHRIVDIDRPNLNSLNCIMSQIVSSITGPTRFSGRVDMQLSNIQTDLIPYERFRFLLPNYSPLYPSDRCCVSFHTSDLVDQAFHRQIVMATCNPNKGKYLAGSLFFRGDHVPKDINK